ncbi:hypothetical protein BVY04_02485 [bacterium M21]|nr:hypothetical protein BVY04_02485 [bacterium M21]
MTMTPELLAPASNLEAAMTAFECGADAVYAGLEKFNARERGENFSTEKLGQLIGYARRKGKKVYVTLNTLLKEEEMEELTEMLGQLVLLRPDAVIVQDLGLINILRTDFPELTIHASTQMAIHNSAGVQLLEKLGVERVILERQVTLEELKQIRAVTTVELEVFIHGALCCCRSGTCLFSSWIGGWSGNRGKCKQPCRRRFYSDSGNGFFFSTNDLYSLDMVEELKELGIASLKIEGRLRKGDYVRSVVSAYRHMLDAPQTESKKRLGEAKQILTGSLGRRWSSGFRSEKDFDTVIEHQRMGVSGLLIGQVQATAKNGFDVNLAKPLTVGDRIRIQPSSGEEGPSIQVTRLTANRRQTNRAPRNSTCFVHCDKEVPEKGNVYLISTPTEKSSGLAPDTLAQLDAAIDLDVAITQNQISIALPQFDMGWQRALDLDAAKKRPLAPETVETELRKTGRGNLLPHHIHVTIDGEYFLPLSIMKELRQGFWQWATEQLTPETLSGYTKRRIESARQRLATPFPCPIANSSSLTVIASPTADSINEPHIRTSLISNPGGADEILLPDFCPEAQLPELRNQLRQAATKATRIRITSLYGLQLIDELKLDLPISTSFPLPVTNTAALRELLLLDVEKAGMWIELEKEALEPMIARAGGHLEQMVYGRPVLLSTRANLPVNGELKDDRGNGYSVLVENQLGQLYSSKPLQLPKMENVHHLIDLTHAKSGEQDTSTFNFNHTLA